MMQSNCTALTRTVLGLPSGLCCDGKTRLHTQRQPPWGFQAFLEAQRLLASRPVTGPEEGSWA